MDAKHYSCLKGSSYEREPMEQVFLERLGKRSIAASVLFRGTGLLDASSLPRGKIQPDRLRSRGRTTLFLDGHRALGRQP